ncbi:hypothetical protein [Bacteroides sp.]|uniref:hypothetical protein n=1 Tax=Bacteroides sp. TaxID=29523 RepID=UPI0011DDBD0E|nr:hypothetical protein [Bacteroides sp.]
MIAEKIANVTNSFDKLCNNCIDVLEGLSKDIGMSYGELNVWLFVIIQPALILIFFTTTVILTIRLYRKNKDFKRGNLITASISTIVIIAFVIAMLLAAAYVFLILAIGGKGIDGTV